MDNNTLTDHAYDGIQEYDNPLPGWWSYLFIATIIFSVGYIMWYHTGAPDRNIEAEYSYESEVISKLALGDIGELQANDETLVKYAYDPKGISVGQGIFRANCISCHGRKGEGNVGPNLTDDFYKYVRTPVDIHTIIAKGAGNGAMPAWGTRLDAKAQVLVSSYVMSLRGQNLPGKAADGQQIAPWPPAPPPAPKAEADSEKKK